MASGAQKGKTKKTSTAMDSGDGVPQENGSSGKLILKNPKVTRLSHPNTVKLNKRLAHWTLLFDQYFNQIRRPLVNLYTVCLPT